MKVLDPGHRYAIDVLDGPGSVELRFVKREGSGYPGNVGAYAGTTTQEVLRACVDRTDYVHAQVPALENQVARLAMMIAIWLFERRAARRHGRSVPSFTEATFGDRCTSCLHVGCTGRCR